MATQPVDDFEDAFSKFANPPTEGASDPVDDLDTQPAAEPDPEPASGADAEPAGDPDPDPSAEPAAASSEPEPAEPAPAAPAANDDQTDELIKRLASMVKDAPAQPQAQAEPQPQAQPEAELYTPEELEFLNNYDQDWSDVTRGEALKRRKEHVELVQYVFQEVAQQLRPLLESVDVLASRTHLSDLRERVEDYDTVRDNVVAWVEEQPAYLQVAYKHVISSGTAEEVADLISRYKQATGFASQAPAPAKAEPSDDAKKAAQALAPVSTKRSTMPQQDDPSDFDSAFKRFATGKF